MPPIPSSLLKKTSEIGYDGIVPLFNKQVKAGAGMNDVLCLLDKILQVLFKNDAIECINLSDLGIDCPDPNKTKQCIILEYLTNGLLNTTNQLNTVLQALQTLQQGSGSFVDEKVKVTPASANSGYLVDLLQGPPDTLEVTDTNITFMGFVPIGFRGTINSNRIGDFDGTGKGKQGTDMWGWALNNGNNGLLNLLNSYPFTDAIANADTKVGQASFIVTKNNIQTMAFPVTGVINNALAAPFSFSYATFEVLPQPQPIVSSGIINYNSFLYAGRPTTGQSSGLDLSHSHTFSLNAALLNDTPVPIEYLPLHIKQLPIERIIP